MDAPTRMTFGQFRATKQETPTLLVYAYKGDINAPDEDLEQECLFINKDGDGGYNLHIENQIYFGRCGTCEFLTQAMTKYLRDPEFVALGLNCLTNLSINTDNQIGLGRNGGCEMLLKIMVVHPSLAKQVNAARLNLSFKNEENRVRLRLLSIGDEKFDIIYNFSYQGRSYQIGFNVGDDPVFVVRRFIQREPDFAPYQSNIVEWLMVQILEPEKEPEEEDAN